MTSMTSMTSVTSATSPPSPPSMARATKKPPFPDTLVLAGGGIKGVAVLGAVERLGAAGLLSKVRTVVGTSAGALIGALVATRKDLRGALDTICRHGYTPDFDFDRFGTEFGLDSGKCIETMTAALLEGPLTFADIKAQYGVSLVVCVTNLTRRRAQYLGPDTHPDMHVATAIRMSCSVPLYFSAVKYEGEWFVDGSIMDNFPCNWALDHGSTRVLGISSRASSTLVRTFEAFVGALVECAASSQPCARADVLDLDLPGISALHFGAPRAELVGLFTAGVHQADAFVKKRM